MKNVQRTPAAPQMNDEETIERTPSGRLIVGNVIHIVSDRSSDDRIVPQRPFSSPSHIVASLPTTTLPLTRPGSIPNATTEQSGIKQRLDLEAEHRSSQSRAAAPSVVRPSAGSQVVSKPALPGPAPHPSQPSYASQPSQPVTLSAQATIPLTPAPVVPETPAEVHAPAPVANPLFDPMKLNKLVVSSYKVMGFAILGAILLGLASFIFTNVFYMTNSSWTTPLMLSSTDPRVLQLVSQLSQEKAARDAVATQRLQLQAQLEDAKRIQASEGRFQAAFQDAMLAEAADRGSELAQLQRLIRDVRKTRSDVADTSRDYTAVSKEQIKDEYAAHLIGKDEATRGGYELSQIAGANLALHEKHVEIDARITELQRAVSSLRNGKAAASYEVLHMRHEYEQSVLASKKAEGDAEAFDKSIAMLDATIAGYDAQIARIARAPYVMAADRSVTTAFVPYDNAEAAKVGEPVYSCFMGPLFCRNVGKVAEVLDGEVIDKHPLHNRDLRGLLVRLELTDPSAVQHPVLQLHRKPLFL
jgi:hypothetical protein